MDIVTLSESEQELLRWIMHNGRESYHQRAQLLLLQELGKTSVEIGQVVGLSPGRVRHWLRAFREKRMAVFPDEILYEAEAAKTNGEEPPTKPSEEELPESQSQHLDLLPTVTVLEICHQEKVNMAHARYVSKLAQALFDLTRTDHQLGDHAAAMLHTAAMLSDIDLDALAVHQMEDVSTTDQQFLACVLAFLPGKYKPKRQNKEAACLALPEPSRQEALALAALLRIAKALDYSGSQSSELGQSQSLEDELELRILGPSALEDALQAQEKMDLWQALFDKKLRLVVQMDSGSWGEPVAARGGLTAQKRESPGIVPDDMMAEAGRKLIRLHCERMLFYEPGTRSGEDIENLHKMRVATRRMRSAFQLFGSYYDAEVLKGILKGLRSTARALGHVRDWDVFMEKAGHYLEIQDQGERIDLEPLLDGWKNHREESRITLMAYLDSRQYTRFLEAIGAFATTPGAGVRRPGGDHGLPDRVYQVVPTLVYSRYEAVRRFEPVISDAPLRTLHALRIDCKRFRYALEFFREVLGSDVDLVIEETVTMQDHLGDLNDADVACQILIDYLEEWRQQERREKVDISGVTRYLVAKQKELRHLLDSFPQSWAHFTRGEVRRALAMAVSEL